MNSGTQLAHKPEVNPFPGIPLVAMASIFVVLVSGIYLAERMSAFDLAWPKVAIIALQFGSRILELTAVVG